MEHAYNYDLFLGIKIFENFWKQKLHFLNLDHAAYFLSIFFLFLSDDIPLVLMVQDIDGPTDLPDRSRYKFDPGQGFWCTIYNLLKCGNVKILKCLKSFSVHRSPMAR